MKDILIVEDGKLERQRLNDLFTGAGFSVEAVESVSEAEALLENHRFRLAILDIGLNDRSGSTLFSTVQQQQLVPFVIIYTGNPSVHLRQRFLDEGAADFIVKGSASASSEELLARVQSLVGSQQEGPGRSEGPISLSVFIESYLDEESRGFFLDDDGEEPQCPKCGARRWGVTFSHETQMPPEISGLVVCLDCGKPMDPEIG